MAYAACLFEILIQNIDSVDPKHSSARQDVEQFFRDLLLDPEFDNIGRLDPNSDEFDIYKDLGALPKAYR
jgi:hypothetical protein